MKYITFDEKCDNVDQYDILCTISGLSNGKLQEPSKGVVNSKTILPNHHLEKNSIKKKLLSYASSFCPNKERN